MFWVSKFAGLGHPPRAFQDVRGDFRKTRALFPSMMREVGVEPLDRAGVTQNIQIPKNSKSGRPL